MRLIKGNVERVAKTTEQVEMLKANGFEEIGSVGKPKSEQEDKSLAGMKVDALRALAKEKDIEGHASLTKEELLAVLKDVM